MQKAFLLSLDCLLLFCSELSNCDRNTDLCKEKKQLALVSVTSEYFYLISWSL